MSEQHVPVAQVWEVWEAVDGRSLVTWSSRSLALPQARFAGTSPPTQPRSQAGPGVPGPASVLQVFPGCIVWESGLNNLSLLILATFKEKH